MTIWESGWHMANHFLYELKARLKYAVDEIKDEQDFRTAVESMYRDLCIEVDPYGTPGDEDPNVTAEELSKDKHQGREPGPGEIWEEPSKSQREEGIKPRRIK